MTDKYLPIGSVVMLNNAKKRVMIIGFKLINKNDENKQFDYVGVLYPEGMVDLGYNMLFNHDQIEKIYYLGLIDDEEKEFKKKLNAS